MPAIIVAIPDALARFFPETPSRFGWLVFQRRNVADQQTEDARLIERLLGQAHLATAKEPQQ